MAGKGKTAYFLLGAICMTLSFIGAIIAGVYVADKNSREDYVIAKYLPELQATEAALDDKVKELASEGDEVIPVRGNLPDDTVWIADLSTGEIIFVNGRSKGVHKDFIYDIYDGTKLLGKFRVEYAFKYLSMGKVIDYEKTYFPGKRRFFRAQLSR